MLIQFTIENYKSFRDKQSLSFVSSQGDEHPEHVVELDNGLRINKVAAIIGGNGTGKSQLLLAMVNFMAGVGNNTLHELHSPYAFSREMRNSPTKYEVIIINKDRKLFLRYGISVLKEKIISEYLYSRPVRKSSKESCVFDRINNEIISIKPEYKKVETLINPLLNDSGAIITFSKSLNIQELGDVALFSAKQLLYVPEKNSNTVIEVIEKLLQNNISENKKENVEKYLKRYNEYLKSCPIYIDSVDFQPQGDEGKFGFIYKLKCNDKNEYLIVDLKKRSDFFSKGTINILGFIALLIWCYENECTIYADEIDSSLHYSLASNIIKKVIHDTCLLDNAQFIFSTHNIPLLDDSIRRDELNIIYKNKEKSSDIINASKFSVRKDAKISAKYLRGEFGSLPTFLDGNLKG